MDDGEAHHAGHLIAVAIQIVESLDLARLEIRANTRDHLMEILTGNLVALHRVMEGRPQGIVAVLAGQRPIQIPAPAVDGLARSAGSLADVIAVAHEGVDSTHRVALFAGKQQERVIEIARASAGDTAAEGVGRSTGIRACVCYHWCHRKNNTGKNACATAVNNK